MSITLTRAAVEYERQTGQCAWPLSVTALSSEPGLSSDLFVYHVYPENDEIEEVFECVASLPQMSEIDTSPQLSGDTIVPYYRKDSFRLDCRSPEEADGVWDLVQADVESLLTDYRRAQGLALEEEVVIA
jgi:hypothetical protein